MKKLLPLLFVMLLLAWESPSSNLPKYHAGIKARRLETGEIGTIWHTYNPRLYQFWYEDAQGNLQYRDVNEWEITPINAERDFSGTCSCDACSK